VNFTKPTTPAAGSEASTFTDAGGRSWSLQFNIFTYQRIREELAIDFRDLEAGNPLLILANDALKLVAVLWILCEDQASAAEVKPDQFARGLNGAAIDRACEALVEATIEFAGAHTRPALRALLQKTLDAQASAMKQIEQWADENGERLANDACQAAQTALAKL
jgi:hypothetical protein